MRVEATIGRPSTYRGNTFSGTVLTHRLTGNNGCASEKLYQLCDATVVPEYRDLVRIFVPTLAERLKNGEYISTEYRMCDGSWH